MRDSWVEQPDASLSIQCDGFDQEYMKVEAILKSLGRIQDEKAFKNAMKTALRTARKEASRMAAKEYTARRSKLFDNIRADYSAWQLVFTGSFGMNLYHFKPNPATPDKRPAAGVSSQVKRKGRRYVHYSKDYNDTYKPFIMKKKRGGEDGGYGIFVREKDGAGFGAMQRPHSSGRSYQKYWGNYHMLFGPSPIQALMRKDIQNELKEKTVESFGKALNTEIDKMLSGSFGR